MRSLIFPIICSCVCAFGAYATPIADLQEAVDRLIDVEPKIAKQFAQRASVDDAAAALKSYADAWDQLLAAVGACDKAKELDSPEVSAAVKRLLKENTQARNALLEMADRSMHSSNATIMHASRKIHDVSRLVIPARQNLPPSDDTAASERQARETADRKNAQVVMEQFKQKWGIQDWIQPSQLKANPFVFEGKVIAVPLTFMQMISPTEAIFDEEVLVTDIPKGNFTQRTTVLIGGVAKGTRAIKTPFGGEANVPVIKYLSEVPRFDDIRRALQPQEH